MTRLVNTFTELVQTSSESRNEGEFHELLKTKLKALGLTLFEDDVAVTHQLGGNNIIATLQGVKQVPPIFFQPILIQSHRVNILKSLKEKVPFIPKVQLF